VDAGFVPSDVKEIIVGPCNDRPGTTKLGNNQSITQEEAEALEEVEAPSEDDEVEDETPAAAKEKNGPSAGAPYHLSKRVSDGKWQLFIAGSDKVMKTFNTKVEAEEYTYALAAKTGRKVLVHKSKGANKGKVSKAKN
jgi:hypothetical protein